MATDKEKTYSRAVVSGMITGLGTGLILSGIGFSVISKNADNKYLGVKVIAGGIVTAIVGMLLAPPIEDINALKGQ